MSPALPMGWIPYEATVRYSDGTIRAQHTFHAPADATDAELKGRAWSIWSPARAGMDGRFLDPTLTVVSAVRRAA